MNRSLFYSVTAILFSLSFFILALAILQTYCGISPYKSELTNYRCPVKSYGFLIPVIASSIFATIVVQALKRPVLIKFLVALVIAIPVHLLFLALSFSANKLFFLNLFGEDTTPIGTLFLGGVIGVPLLLCVFIFSLDTLKFLLGIAPLQNVSKKIIKVGSILITFALLVLALKSLQVLDSSKKYQTTYKQLNQQFCAETKELQDMKSKISVDPQIEIIGEELHVNVIFSEMLKNNYDVNVLLRFSNKRNFKMWESVFWEANQPLLANGKETSKKFIFKLDDVKSRNSDVFQKSVQSGNANYLFSSDEITFSVTLSQSLEDSSFYKAPELEFYCYQPLFEDVPPGRECRREVSCSGVSFTGQKAIERLDFSNLILSK